MSLFDIIFILKSAAKGTSASGIDYDNSSSGLNSNKVQGAIDELAERDPKVGSITFSGTWTGASSPYTQTVTVTGVTVGSNSKVDLQPTAAQIVQMTDDGVTGVVIQNDNGTLTAYAIGAPISAMTMQVTVSEVS